MKSKVEIKLERALCTLDVPLFESGVTYNRFIVPDGCTYEGRNVSGMYFYPYSASAAEDNSNYCIARYPENFNVQLVNIITNKAGNFIDKEEIILKAKELEDIIENRSLDFNKNKEIDINEPDFNDETMEEIETEKEVLDDEMEM